MRIYFKNEKSDDFKIVGKILTKKIFKICQQKSGR